MSTTQEICDIIESLQKALPDAEKFDKGTAAAGTRVRKVAQQAKKDLDALRKNIQTIKAARKNG